MAKCRAGQILALLFTTFLFPISLSSQQPTKQPATIAGTQVLSLDECLELALAHNQRRTASQFGLAMAEAQHRQALSAYWPQVDLKFGTQRADEPLNYIFPSSSFAVPAQAITVPGGAAAVTIPANAFGPGFPPSTIQLPVNYPNQTINTPPQHFTVPEQNQKLLDRDLVAGSTSMTWLLYDGGMRKGMREQASGLVAMMRQEVRRTDLEIADSVRRMYWGAVLARQLHQLGKDTLTRMEMTLQLTKTMYEGGGGKVTRSDYLDNDVMVESLRGMVAQLEKNETMSQFALANTMGMRWTASIIPSAQEIPFAPALNSIDELVVSSYQFSPDWNKLEAGIHASEGAIRTARSSYFPKIALTGELHRWWNGGFNSGIATAQNGAGWTTGVGLQVPLFNGFLTQNKVREALARKSQLKQSQLLLRDGLGLQIKDLVLSLEMAVKSRNAALRAMKSATDNRDLNTRAYESELVETEKVIRSQLVEALMSAQYYKSNYDYVVLESQLKVVVGK